MATRTKTITIPLGTDVEGVQHADTVFNDSAGVFTDETSDAANTTTNDVTFTGAVGDNIYIGSDRQFIAAWIDIGTTAPAGGVRTWEYWNGSTWAALSGLTFITGNANLTADSSFHWTLPTDWATTAVNSVTRYWIRGRVTTLYTTAGQASVFGIAPFNLMSGTFYSPETSGRTIRSAWFEIATRTPILQQFDVMRVDAKFGSAARGTIYSITTAGHIAAPAETMGRMDCVDCTAELNTGLSTGSSCTVELNVAYLQRGGTTLSGHRLQLNALLHVTYDYDDTSATQINTVWLPIDSLTGDLATTHTTIGGTGGIPALDTLLPEASKVYRHWAVIFQGNESEAGTTDWDFYIQIDSDAEVRLRQCEATNQSGAWFRSIYDDSASPPATNAAHDLKARSTSVAAGGRCPCLGAVLLVTYEFDASAANDRTVSLYFPQELAGGYIFGSAAAGDRHSSRKTINIQEAGIALIQSGIILTYQAANDPTDIVVNVGAQTARTYNVRGGTTDSGPWMIHHRFDAGAVAGTGGLTIARGDNEIRIEARATLAGNANAGGAFAQVFLNFTCDKNTANKTQSARWLCNSTRSALSTRFTFTFAPVINEANYWLDVASFEFFDLHSSSAHANLKVPLGSGEGHYTFQEFPAVGPTQGLRRNAYNMVNVGLIKRHPNDPVAGRLDIETSRTYAVEHTGCRAATVFVAVWHDFRYTKTVAITGSAGGTVEGETYREGTNELIDTFSRVGDGNVTIEYYDNTVTCWNEARESSTLLGRSDDFTFA